MQRALGSTAARRLGGVFGVMVAVTGCGVDVDSKVYQCQSDSDCGESAICNPCNVCVAPSSPEATTCGDADTSEPDTTVADSAESDANPGDATGQDAVDTSGLADVPSDADEGDAGPDTVIADTSSGDIGVDTMVDGCTSDAECSSLDDGCVVGRCNLTSNECFADFSDEPCEDGLSCTSGDQCVDGSCQPGPVNAGNCIIDGECVAEGEQDPTGECRACIPTLSDNSYSARPNGTTLCNADDNGCTVDDTCMDGSCVAGDPPLCTGSTECTFEVCSNTGPSSYECVPTTVPGQCIIDTVCYGPGATHPTNPCLSCSPTESSTDWTPRPSGDICDTDVPDCFLPAVCNATANCDPPELKPVGSLCGSSVETLCDLPDTCNSAGVCVPNYEPNSKECLTSSSVCWQNAKCDGAGQCGELTLSGSGTVCGPPAGECFEARLCDSTGSCAASAQKANNSDCGSSSNTQCTNPDKCTNGVCMPNHKPNGESCGSSTSSPETCDLPDMCVNGICDSNPSPAGTPCAITPIERCCTSTGSCVQSACF